MDEHTSATTSRREVREALDAALDESGVALEARALGRDPEQAKRDAATDSPANERGANELLAIAAGGRG